ncbi:MAG: alkaline phosphatase family protein [Myxococcales bacterium]|nr:alkaline phosphatase family protein [Myxococcales bacterium]MDD9972098.1 alkaline phosphatase family protein [Myxococcales bacterium]
MKRKRDAENPKGGMRRVVVIGLDCVPPRLAFDLFARDMPHLHELMARGTWGPMHSTIPPITVPAWACMFSGRDPGELGVYGFQTRKGGSYRAELVRPSDLRAERVWHELAAVGRKPAVLFVPPSFPPEAFGIQVGCFLTPSSRSPHTYPPRLQAELEQRFGPYRMDVEDFRSDDLDRIGAELREMTCQHFDIASHILAHEQPDLLVMVDIGPDRFHHAFYQHIEPRHPQYQEDGPYARAGHDYYALLDHKIGQLLAHTGDDTTVIVASDHGARPLLGGVCLNEWLIEHGYLRLREYPKRVTPLSELAIDWSRTRAFGEGGYCGRIQLNLAGREPQGIVPEHAREALVVELAQGLSELDHPHGKRLRNLIVPPSAYRGTYGRPPDLQVFFDDLNYRALGSVGHRCLFTATNDRGPDGCNHDWHGIFVMAGGGVPARGRVDDLQIYDVAKTLRSLLQLPGYEDLLGSDRSL